MRSIITATIQKALSRPTLAIHAIDISMDVDQIGPWLSFLGSNQLDNHTMITI